MANFSTYFDKFTNKVQLDFSQNFPIENKGFLGDRLFPDRKSQYLEAEIDRIVEDGGLPFAAKVHGLDTEAEIGVRPGIEALKLEEFFIKEKIDQGEQLKKNLRLVSGDRQALVDYVFDDWTRLARNVKTRTEVMKMELLTTGQVKIQENNISTTIDYGVPAANKVKADWSDPNHDILRDIRNWVEVIRENGYEPTHMVIGRDVATTLFLNTKLKEQMGAPYVGPGPNLLNQVQDFFKAATGLDEIIEYKKFYRILKSDGKTKTLPYVAKNAIAIYSAASGATVGAGLWGVTPEEAALGPWTAKSQKQFVTVTSWEEPDPVTLWTKASGIFVPILRNPKGLLVGTVTPIDESALDPDPVEP